MKNIKKTLALPGLVFATILWGFSFVVCKDAVHVISPLYMIALRFTAASVLMIPFLYRKIRHMTLQDLKCGLLTGVALFVSYVLQTYGVKYTTAGNNAFLTTTYVIIVPFLYWITTKKRPDLFTFSAAVLTMIGIGFITLNNGFSVINKGDVLTVLCGLTFAIHILMLSTYTKEHDVSLMTFLQLAAAGILGWIFAPLTEGKLVFHGLAAGETTVFYVIGVLLYLSVGCSLICFYLQTMGLKYIRATVASIVLSMEAIFGVTFSVLLGYEDLTIKTVIGFSLILLSVIMSETKFGYKGPRKAGINR
ncbi:MAG: DMT family transporter [Clostridia bacterium]